MNAVKIENLTKTFDHITAVDSVSLEIEKGSVVGLIGPDGAGKTTLLRMLAGLLHPTQGSILLADIDTAKDPQKVKRKIGYMPQHFSLYGDLTVAENLKFFADMYQVSGKDFRERKRELLRFSQLASFERRLARNLSGGMQKKLALACNLFHTPAILLLDEPTTGVDPISRRELWNLLFQLNERGTTIILTTPYMDEAQRCHRVGLVYRGRLLTFEPPEALIQGMADEVIEVLADQERARKALAQVPGIRNMYPFGEALHIVFERSNGGSKKIEQLLNEKGIPAKRVTTIAPSFEDVFLALIQKEEENPANKLP